MYGSIKTVNADNNLACLLKNSQLVVYEPCMEPNGIQILDNGQEILEQHIHFPQYVLEKSMLKYEVLIAIDL